MKSAITHHAAFFVYPGFVLLDLSGPLEAFAAAASLAPGSYRTSVMSLEGGEIQSSTGLKVMTQPATVEAIDTFIVVGDFGLAHQVIARRP
jgi:transcriptional regulator GlxA family with amidase domain